MNLSTGTVWKILRKISRKYPNKPKTVQSLTDYTNCVEYNFAIGGAFEYKLKCFKKKLNR